MLQKQLIPSEHICTGVDCRRCERDALDRQIVTGRWTEEDEAKYREWRKGWGSREKSGEQQSNQTNDEKEEEYADLRY